MQWGDMYKGKIAVRFKSEQDAKTMKTVIADFFFFYKKLDC